MGNPVLLEELLARHPKLRVLLQANSHVSVDVAGLIWSYPLVEVNRYIQRLIETGFCSCEGRLPIALRNSAPGLTVHPATLHDI